MSYIQRLATPDDQNAITSLWRFFAAERQEVDPFTVKTMTVLSCGKIDQ